MMTRTNVHIPETLTYQYNTTLNTNIHIEQKHMTYKSQKQSMLGTRI